MERFSRYLILLPVILLVMGQICSKYGVELLSVEGKQIGYIFLLVGYGFLFLRGFVWIIVLRRYAISYAYPMLGLAYVLVLLFSVLLFNENFTYETLIGAASVVIGIILLQDYGNKQ